VPSLQNNQRRQPAINQPPKLARNPRKPLVTIRSRPILHTTHKMSTNQIICPMSPESQSTTPTHESSAPILTLDEPMKEETEQEPLYTEINIPLPRLPSPSYNSQPQPPTSLSPPPQSRSRSRSLSLFRPRSISLSSRPSLDRKSEDTSRKTIRNRDIVAAMDLSHQSRGRRGTIDALAVVPAVLVLSAELFTPGVGERGVLERGIR
jgi:hypothetical protein